MKRVLILNNEKNVREELKEIVKGINPEAVIYMTRDIGIAYQTVMENTVELFLIDISLKKNNKQTDVSGMEFAENIRQMKKYKFTPIIFVTGVSDEENHAYKTVHCFDYFEKPYEHETLTNSIREALEFHGERRNDRVLFYKVRGVLKAIRVKDIVYVKSEERGLRVVTTESSCFVLYKTCKEFLQETDSEEFLQCNWSTVVNRNFIQSVDIVSRYIRLQKCKDELEIGSSYKKAFVSKLEDYNS